MQVVTSRELFGGAGRSERSDLPRELDALLDYTLALAAHKFIGALGNHKGVFGVVTDQCAVVNTAHLYVVVAKCQQTSSMWLALPGGSAGLWFSCWPLAHPHVHTCAPSLCHD